METEGSGGISLLGARLSVELQIELRLQFGIERVLLDFLCAVT